MKIHAIKTGTVEIKQAQRCGKGRGAMRQINMLFDQDWTEPLPIYAWAIEHSEGVIVVDTGETAKTADADYFPRWHPYYRFGVRLHVRPEQEIGPQLRKLGIAAKDVRTVILTHLHTDHAGGLHHFPHSRIFVSAADFKRANGFSGRLRGFLPNRWPRWFNPIPIPFERIAFGAFAQSFKLTAKHDVVIVPTSGHTPAHVSVIAMNHDLSYFLAGDTTYTEQLLLRKQVDGVSPDERISLQTMNKILQYAQRTPTIYLPSHDPDSAKRLADERVVVNTQLQSV